MSAALPRPVRRMAGSGQEKRIAQSVTAQGSAVKRAGKRSGARFFAVPDQEIFVGIAEASAVLAYLDGWHMLWWELLRVYGRGTYRRPLFRGRRRTGAVGRGPGSASAGMAGLLGPLLTGDGTSRNHLGSATGTLEAGGHERRCQPPGMGSPEGRGQVAATGPGRPRITDRRSSRSFLEFRCCCSALPRRNRVRILASLSRFLGSGWLWEREPE